MIHESGHNRHQLQMIPQPNTLPEAEGDVHIPKYKASRCLLAIPRPESLPTVHISAPIYSSENKKRNIGCAPKKYNPSPSAPVPHASSLYASTILDTQESRWVISLVRDYEGRERYWRVGAVVIEPVKRGKWRGEGRPFGYLRTE